ncbi:hypothetical protein QBC46DRAFT_418643 [Diplogelasinospora grovesii]|uniref:Uncharacterized protein n=1 Tax=Diplogelasinospora grovesii TaxID=303347 RepID=A0AAN6N383_9PEZI|nr:hypothetical protein QBC46DRAFT_418643 [Diplogelasinospora grovesii]
MGTYSLPDWDSDDDWGSDKEYYDIRKKKVVPKESIGREMVPYNATNKRTKQRAVPGGWPEDGEEVVIPVRRRMSGDNPKNLASVLMAHMEEQRAQARNRPPLLNRPDPFGRSSTTARTPTGYYNTPDNRGSSRDDGFKPPPSSYRTLPGCTAIDHPVASTTPTGYRYTTDGRRRRDSYRPLTSPTSYGYAPNLNRRGPAATTPTGYYNPYNADRPDYTTTPAPRQELLPHPAGRHTHAHARAVGSVALERTRTTTTTVTETDHATFHIDVPRDHPSSSLDTSIPEYDPEYDRLKGRYPPINPALFELDMPELKPGFRREEEETDKREIEKKGAVVGYVLSCIFWLLLLNAGIWASVRYGPEREQTCTKVVYDR